MKKDVILRHPKGAEETSKNCRNWIWIDSVAFGDLTMTSLILALTAALLLAGCTTRAKPDIKTKDVLRSVFVEKGPKIDGKGKDPVWKEAPERLIKTKNGPNLKIKSVYTDKRIYFLVSWNDVTPRDGALWWEFDGKEWYRNYETDDKISFIWNIDHSLPLFDEEGCSALCHKVPNGQGMSMYLTGKKTAEGPWPGIKWKGDAWKWAPGVMNLKMTVDDGIFAAPPEAREHPELTDVVVSRLIFDGGDAGTKQWFTRNPNAATEEEKARGIEKPAFMPRSGYDLSKNPFPNMRDMVPITDYSKFKAGDRLPMMLYFDLTSEKNRKDFPQGKPSGSRVDLTGKGTYSDGAYTLEFERLLNTGYVDDVRFRTQPGTAVAENVFGIAVFDDTRFNHATSGPVTLILEPK